MLSPRFGRWNRFIPACAGNSRAKRAHPRTAPVHPRVCGELDLAKVRRPKARRFIPACAGNSSANDGRRDQHPVHPRVCGELHDRRGGERRPARFIPACAGNSFERFHSAITDRGSSPRVRGTRGSSPPRPTTLPVHPRVCGELVGGVQGGALMPRFIPACAGNSPAAWTRPSRSTVHPRVCGELMVISMSLICLSGSSPRVRGTLAEQLDRVVRGRFIPACAGNSNVTSATASARTVHPRVCGELVQRDVETADRGRFIPACAGNSPDYLAKHDGPAGSSPRVRGTRAFGCGSAAAPPVHPRVCGELAGAAIRRQEIRRFIPACAGNSVQKRGREADEAGSSPRVRGTPRPLPAPCWRSRFIPACAGNSRRRSGWSWRATVHPRVCGELEATARSNPSRSTVHPRVCGELDSPRRGSLLPSGSSPRVRGTRRRRPRSGISTTVHPRVCGELGGTELLLATAPGSSPRVRGTRGSIGCRRR